MNPRAQSGETQPAEYTEQSGAGLAMIVKDAFFLLPVVLVQTGLHFACEYTHALLSVLPGIPYSRRHPGHP